MVSHNLAVVAHLCPIIGVMQGGENRGNPERRATCEPAGTRHPHTAALRELSVELEEPEGRDHDRDMAGRA